MSCLSICGPVRGELLRRAKPSRSSRASVQAQTVRRLTRKVWSSRLPRGDRRPDAWREGWLREARHQLDEHRRLQAQPIPRSRAERLLQAEQRLRENLRVEQVANDAYEYHRATAVSTKAAASLVKAKTNPVSTVIRIAVHNSGQNS